MLSSLPGLSNDNMLALDRLEMNDHTRIAKHAVHATVRHVPGDLERVVQPDHALKHALNQDAE